MNGKKDTHKTKNTSLYDIPQKIVTVSDEEILKNRSLAEKNEEKKKQIAIAVKKAEDSFIDAYIECGSIEQCADLLRIEDIPESKTEVLKRAVALVGSTDMTRLIAERKGLTMAATAEALSDAMKNAEIIEIDREGVEHNLGPDHNIRVQAAKEALKIFSKPGTKIINNGTIQNNNFSESVNQLQQILNA